MREEWMQRNKHMTPSIHIVHIHEYFISPLRVLLSGTKSSEERVSSLRCIHKPLCNFFFYEEMERIG